MADTKKFVVTSKHHGLAFLVEPSIQDSQKWLDITLFQTLNA